MPSFANQVTRHRDVKRHVQCPYWMDCFHDFEKVKDRIKPSTVSGYWGRRYRVHIPLLSDSSNVNFVVANKTYHMKVGEVWTFDNGIYHEVSYWLERKQHM